MNEDTAPMRVLLAVDSSTGYVRATDVDQKGGGSGFAAKWIAQWLDVTGKSRMKVQCDAEQAIEHLMKAVKSMCATDMIVQRAPAKSHSSQGHVERAVRLTENQCRAVLFDVQEGTRVEVDPTSAAPALVLYGFSIGTKDIKGGAASFGRLTSSPYRSPIPLLFAMVECLVQSGRKPGGVLVVAKGAPRTFRSMWVGRMEESDEHLGLHESGRCVENENSGPDVVKLTATPSYLEPDGDDVEGGLWLRRKHRSRTLVLNIVSNRMSCVLFNCSSATHPRLHISWLS